MEQKSKVFFFNQNLDPVQSDLEKIGKLRFKKLDEFAKDCATVNNQLKRFGVPDIDWVFVDDADDEKVTYCLGYHEQTLVWKEWGKAEDLAEGLPIYEAPAHVRASILKDNLLMYLMQDAVIELTELKESED